MNHAPISTNKNDEQNSEFVDRLRIKNKMKQIKHKVLVMSGKGGVGKSTIAANLATSLSLQGYKVGLLDVDIHGPSIPTMFNVASCKISDQGEDGIEPIEVNANLKLISISFFLENPDQPIIWRGPMKIGLIKQFLKDVNWGSLDFLVIDSPPGTGDEPLAVIQQIGDVSAGVVVTTPQEVANADVRKNINFARKLNLPIAGIIENMSGFKCPCCNEVTHIFNQGGGKKLAEKMQLPLLGEIPIESELAKACDEGKAFVETFKDTFTAKIFASITEKLITYLN